jgi:hypothetical protein
VAQASREARNGPTVQYGLLGMKLKFFLPKWSPHTIQQLASIPGSEANDLIAVVSALRLIRCNVSAEIEQENQSMRQHC